MASLETSVVIGRSGSDVFAFTANPANGGTRSTWTVDPKTGFGGAFGRMTDSAILRMFWCQSEFNLENLRRLLEA